jgi:hypothetical protein
LTLTWGIALAFKVVIVGYLLMIFGTGSFITTEAAEFRSCF